MPKLFALLTLACVCAGCQTRVTRYTILSTRKVDVSRVETVTKGATPVQGSAGSLGVGKIPLSVRGVAHEMTGRSYGNQHLDLALDRALAGSPGAVGMADVVVHDTVFAVPFLWDYRSCRVKGLPLIAPVAPADAPEPVASAASSPSLAP